MDHLSAVEATDSLNLLQVHVATLSPMWSCSILQGSVQEGSWLCLYTFVSLDTQHQLINKIADMLVYTHIHPPTSLHSSFMTDSHNDQLAS
jgi:hypothetical protein